MASIFVVAAMCGNFWHESSLNPGVWENLTVGNWTDLRKGYGLGQWTNVGSSRGRLYNLYTWLTSNGYAVDSGDGQVAYLSVENYWTPNADYPFNTLQEFLDSDSTDVTMLTHAWNRCWEGIRDSSWDTRVEYAQRCLLYIQQHKDDTGLSWVSGNRFLSVNERLNNAVKVYQTIGGSTPPTPPTPTKRKGMPVWMMCRRIY